MLSASLNKNVLPSIIGAIDLFTDMIVKYHGLKYSNLQHRLEREIALSMGASSGIDPTTNRTERTLYD